MSDYWSRDVVDHEGAPCACGALPTLGEWFLRTPTRGEALTHTLFGFARATPSDFGLCPAVAERDKVLTVSAPLLPSVRWAVDALQCRVEEDLRHFLGEAPSCQEQRLRTLYARSCGVSEESVTVAHVAPDGLLLYAPRRDHVLVTGACVEHFEAAP